MDNGARGQRRVRGSAHQQPGLLASVLLRVPPRPRRPAPPVLAPEPRSGCVAVVLGLAPLLQPRGDLYERPARVSAAPVPARPLPLDRRARPAEPRRARLAGLGLDR